MNMLTQRDTLLSLLLDVSLRQVGGSGLGAALDAAEAGVWEWNLTTDENSWSPRLWSLYDLVPGSCIPSYAAWLSSVHPDDRQRCSDAVELAVRSGSPLQLEWRVAMRDGGTRWLMSRGGPRRGPDGRVERFLGMVIDVTEDRRAQESQRLSDRLEALRASDARLRVVIEASTDGFWDADLSTGLTFYSARFNEILGDPAVDEIAPTKWMARTHPHSLPAVQAAFGALRTGATTTIDLQFLVVRPDGAPRWVHSRGKIIEHDARGVPMRFCGTLTDVHEAKLAEDALASRERKLAVATEAAGLGVFELDVRTGRAWRNRRHGQLFGAEGPEFDWSLDQMLAQVLPSEREKVKGAIARGLEVGQIAFECHVPAADKGLRRLGVRAAVHYGEGRAPLKVIGCSMQCDAGAVKASDFEDRFSGLRTLAELAPVGIFQTDPGGKLDFANASVEAASGRTAVQFRDEGWEATVHPRDRARVVSEWNQAVSCGRHFAAEYQVLREDHAVVHVQCYGVALRNPDGGVVGYLGVMVDVTNLNAQRRQAAVASRLTALGRLVSGLAHHLNNPLASVISDQAMALLEVEALIDQAGSGARVDPAILVAQLQEVLLTLADARDAGQRIARLVQDLHRFRLPPAGAQPVYLDIAAGRALAVAEASRPAGVTFRLQSYAAPIVAGSEDQLVQLLTQFLANATRAIPPGRPGQVLVSIREAADNVAVIEVTDDGVGLAPETLEHIFDPFFTTEDVGGAMGLGLTLSHAIVSAHGGRLSATSQLGRGSTFRVELPGWVNAGLSGPGSEDA